MPRRYPQDLVGQQAFQLEVLQAFDVGRIEPQRYCVSPNARTAFVFLELQMQRCVTEEWLVGEQR
jgi:hypothetical protein